jgi:Nidogen-like/PEP-CTERM motif
MKRHLLHGFTVGALALAMSLPAPSLHAQAMRTGLGLGGSLPRNDDGSTGLVAFPFTFNLFGTTYGGAYLNNNGNITFSGPMGTYTPFPIVTTGVPMLAPFFADVDTRGGGALMTYGATTVDGHSAFAVNWDGVGYYSDHINKLNYFQLVMINRSDLGAGNFDFEFNFNNIAWETGDASGGSNGLGGHCARMGWSNGTISYEQPGSGVCGAFLDGGVDALNSHSLNSSVDGRYVWNVREGIIVPSGVPEPSTFALLVPGLVGLAGVIRRRRRLV